LRSEISTQTPETHVSPELHAPPVVHLHVIAPMLHVPEPELLELELELVLLPLCWFDDVDDDDPGVFPEFADEVAPEFEFADEVAPEFEFADVVAPPEFADDEEELEPVAVVDPIVPTLMLENVTLLLAYVDSTCEGTPEEVEQDPRATPGVEALPVEGSLLSSHNMLAA